MKKNRCFSSAKLPIPSLITLRRKSAPLSYQELSLIICKTQFMADFFPPQILHSCFHARRDGSPPPPMVSIHISNVVPCPNALACKKALASSIRSVESTLIGDTDNDHLTAFLLSFHLLVRARFLRARAQSLPNLLQTVPETTFSSRLRHRLRAVGEPGTLVFTPTKWTEHQSQACPYAECENVLRLVVFSVSLVYCSLDIFFFFLNSGIL